MIIADAIFYDGTTPTPIQVKVMSTPEGIQIIASHNADGVWEYEKLREQGSDLRQDRMTISHANDPRKFLSLENEALIALIREKAKSNLQKQFETSSPFLLKLWIILGAIALVILLLIHVIIPHSAKYIAPLLPFSIEEKIGAASEQSILTLAKVLQTNKEVPLLCDSKTALLPLETIIADLYEAIRLNAAQDKDLAKRLKQIDSVSIKIINTDLINAIALPAGRIFIFRGLLEKAVQDYDALGLILAHEMAHVMKRDNMTGLIANSSTSILLQPIGKFLGLANFSTLTTSVLSASYTLEAEKAADRLSVPWAITANMNPEKAVAFFEYFKTQDEKEIDNTSIIPLTLLDMFQTHPTDDERIAFYKQHASPSNTANKYGDYQTWINKLAQSCPRPKASDEN